MKRMEDGSYTLDPEDKKDLDIKPGANTTVKEILARGDIGVGTSVPAAFLRKFQEFAEPRQLTVEEAVHMFQGYLHLVAEHPDLREDFDSKCKFLVKSYQEFKTHYA